MQEVLTKRQIERQLDEPSLRGSLRLRIEGMATQGLGNAAISRRLGTSLLHVENVVRIWRQAMRKPDPVFAENHAEKDRLYWHRCLNEGGFPYLYKFPDGSSVHVFPNA